MVTPKHFLFAVVCAALLRSPAAAADGLVPGEMELYPTYYAVGIEIPYTGDDDGGAEAEFVWRRAGEETWRNGVDMTFDREKRFIWASVYPLEAGTPVEVKVTVRDGGDSAVLEGETATRRMILEPAADGHVFYVSPEGSDRNPGTVEKPLRTLRYAATLVGPGDAIYALSGVYREGNLFERLRGEADRPIIISAAEGHKPVLDGSIVIAAGGAVWHKHGDGAYVTDFESPTGYVNYVAQDGLRMYRFRSREEVTGERSATVYGVSYGVARGWYYDRAEGKLYVRNRDGSSPEEHTYNVAVLEQAANLSAARHVVLRGFEIRFYGAAGVSVSEGARGCVIHGNTIHNIPTGVFLNGDKTDDTAIWHNYIYEDGLREYSWNQNKGSGYYRQGITGWGIWRRGSIGRGTSVCHNRISGFFDGIMPGCWKTTDRLDICRDFDIMYNTLWDIGDDAIEIDGAGVNQRIHGNTIRDSFAAISMAGVEKGPVYCTGNDATFHMIMFKLNVGGPESLGWAYTYHNSGYCLSRGEVYGGTAISFPPAATLPIANKVFKNNALICDGLGVRFGNDGYDIDYNCYGRVPDGVPVSFRWEKPKDGQWETVVYQTIEELRKNTGSEVHGMVADPQFAATPGIGIFERIDYGPTSFTDFLVTRSLSGADLTLRDTSPCIDAGVVIRGINEDFAGKAPDIGAFEER
ncbi:MAG: hypothetical protein ACYTAN_06160 [Planctomycetota bacterium]|jgi:hypothetical protein